MDTIANLQTFLSVVETGGFPAAARRLSVAVSVVKKRIDQLESQTGVVLFDRSTRSTNLTDVGRRHLLKRAVVSQLDQLLAQMASKPERVEGHLRVKVPTLLLGLFMSESLNRFQHLHPGITMEIMAIDRPVNPIKEGFDVSIVMEPITWPGVADFELAPIHRRLVASPGYLQKRGMPRAPNDLVMHDILSIDQLGLTWPFLGKTGPVDVLIEPKLKSNSSLHLMNAACMGNGICLMSSHITNPYLARGELVSVLEDYPVPNLWSRVHIPQNRLELSRVQALNSYLQASLKTFDILNTWRLQQESPGDNPGTGDKAIRLHQPNLLHF